MYCCYVVAVLSYPPAEKQLALAFDLVQTFPKRASKAGKSHVSAILMHIQKVSFYNQLLFV